MKRQKNAFSVAEVLIVMVIIGILSVVSLALLKPNEKTMKLMYARAYTSLRDASYSSYIDFLNNNSDIATTSSFVSNTPLTGANQDGNNFCGRLLDYINTSGKPDCSTARTPNTDINKPNFTASNGMRFWVAAPGSMEVTIDASSKETVAYTLVYVDLNGKASPNKFVNSSLSSKRLYDIVVFGVTQSGDVIPLGYQAYDDRYFTLLATYEDDTVGSASYGETARLPLSDLCTAKNQAWGTGTYWEDILSYEFPISTKDMNNDTQDNSKICTRSNDEVNSHCSSTEYKCHLEIPNYY